MSNDFTKINKQIRFMEPHIGGDLNDNNIQFISQKKIIEENNNLYVDLLDDTNDLTRNKNTSEEQKKSSEYIQEKRKEYYTRDARINNFPTIVNDNINLSNPIIYPKNYDPYFEYLYKKGINSINTQVVQNKIYINADSSKRNTESSLNILAYYKLVTNPLIFVNESNILKIKLTDANNKVNVNDKISLQGFNFYTLNYKNINFYFENQSNQVILDITPNYLRTIPYYNVLINISGVTNNEQNYFKNVPLNVINQVQNVTLITTSTNEVKFSFVIPMNFYTDNQNSNVLTSNCTINYYFIGNYPINYVNSALPLSIYNLNPYLLINSVDSEYIYVKLTNELSLINSLSIQINGNWINNTTFETGGETIQIGIVKNIEPSWPNPSKYRLVLRKRLDNIVCIRMTSSEIPNTYKLVYNSTNLNSNVTIANNLLYWQNALDAPSTIYKIEIPVGNYSALELSTLMEKLISDVPRIIENSTIDPFNKIKIEINQSNNITKLISFNDYNLPNCIKNLENIDEQTWKLTINHPYHNQKVGNEIIINNSLNYKNIDKVYINQKHIITEVMGNDFYKITLKYINLLNYFTDEDGGNEIIISTYNSFKLYFNKENTIGNILGFKKVGEQGSITPYCDATNNFTIDNSQSYVYGTESIQIVNNDKENIQASNDFNFDVGRYILIKCADVLFNKCLTPNGDPYFYKIQLQGAPGTMMFNTYVDNPIYFNPPLKYLDYFDFTFVTENNNEFNFYGIDNSMTFEITSISNIPENTNLATYIARI